MPVEALGYHEGSPGDIEVAGGLGVGNQEQSEVNSESGRALVVEEAQKRNLSSELVELQQAVEKRFGARPVENPTETPEKPLWEKILDHKVLGKTRIPVLRHLSVNSFIQMGTGSVIGAKARAIFLATGVPAWAAAALSGAALGGTRAGITAARETAKRFYGAEAWRSQLDQMEQNPEDQLNTIKALLVDSDFQKYLKANPEQGYELYDRYSQIAGDLEKKELLDQILNNPDRQNPEALTKYLAESKGERRNEILKRIGVGALKGAAFALVGYGVTRTLSHLFGGTAAHAQPEAPAHNETAWPRHDNLPIDSNTHQFAAGDNHYAEVKIEGHTNELGRLTNEPTTTSDVADQIDKNIGTIASDKISTTEYLKLEDKINNIAHQMLQSKPDCGIHFRHDLTSGREYAIFSKGLDVKVSSSDLNAIYGNLDTDKIAHLGNTPEIPSTGAPHTETPPPSADTTAPAEAPSGYKGPAPTGKDLNVPPPDSGLNGRAVSQEGQPSPPATTPSPETQPNYLKLAGEAVATIAVLGVVAKTTLGEKARAKRFRNRPEVQAILASGYPIDPASHDTEQIKRDIIEGQKFAKNVPEYIGFIARALGNLGSDYACFFTDHNGIECKIIGSSGNLKYPFKVRYEDGSESPYRYGDNINLEIRHIGAGPQPLPTPPQPAPSPSGPPPRPLPAAPRAPRLRMPHINPLRNPIPKYLQAKKEKQATEAEERLKAIITKAETEPLDETEQKLLGEALNTTCGNIDKSNGVPAGGHDPDRQIARNELGKRLLELLVAVENQTDHTEITDEGILTALRWTLEHGDPNQKSATAFVYWKSSNKKALSSKDIESCAGHLTNTILDNNFGQTNEALAEAMAVSSNKTKITDETVRILVKILCQLSDELGQRGQSEETRALRKNVALTLQYEASKRAQESRPSGQSGGQKQNNQSQFSAAETALRKIFDHPDAEIKYTDLNPIDKAFFQKNGPLDMRAKSGHI